MPYNTSPNMSLPIPQVGTTPGPDYATDGLNASLSILDQHDHSAGNGVAVTPSGLNINSDLSFGSSNAISLKSARFTAQASPLAGGSDLDCVYVSGVDLYYNDGNGNQIRITQSGSIAGVSGSIGNLASPASATYVSATPAFVFQSDASTPANLDGGSLVLRNITASSKGITLNPPNALAANYSLTLPAALPASTKIMSVDSSGNVAASYGVDNSTIEISANTIQVKNAGITRPKQAAVGQQIAASGSSQFFTSSSTASQVPNQSVTITTSGRPVILMVIPENSSNLSNVGVSASSNILGNSNFIWRRDGADIAVYTFRIQVGSTGIGGAVVQIPSGCLTYIDPVAAGTYTYSLWFNTAATGAYSNYIKIVAYEL